VPICDLRKKGKTPKKKPGQEMEARKTHGGQLSPAISANLRKNLKSSTGVSELDRTIGEPGRLRGSTKSSSNWRLTVDIISGTGLGKR